MLAFSFYVAVGAAPAAAVLVLFGGAFGWVLVTAAAVVRVEGDDADGRAGAHPRVGAGPGRGPRRRAARAVRGPECDPAAYHLIRGWVPAGVKAAVVDPDDPTPYWFVATRRPAELAAAIEAARTPSRG